ncbi:hypothetical protein TcasGA2_TC033530 [Tribolium castaneum]|uniref:Uncharacterized protein n=1 Tax=Tribolium castaneum TaxID=7070 RepID=A0A139WFQ3_TRICA|nr:hypothetical protein TcasGA2_TC033530 [Tribolium castaneum]
MSGRSVCPKRAKGVDNDRFFGQVASLKRAPKMGFSSTDFVDWIRECVRSQEVTV